MSSAKNLTKSAKVQMPFQTEANAFIKKLRFDISCALSPRQKIHMKSQALFTQKI